jgi:hypothetical protein
VPIYPACSGEVMVTTEGCMFFPPLVESDGATKKPEG